MQMASTVPKPAHNRRASVAELLLPIHRRGIPCHRGQSRKPSPPLRVRRSWTPMRTILHHLSCRHGGPPRRSRRADLRHLEDDPHRGRSQRTSGSALGMRWQGTPWNAQQKIVDDTSGVGLPDGPMQWKERLRETIQMGPHFKVEEDWWPAACPRICCCVSNYKRTWQ